MATIKSYTDLQQSKELAEILPIESADMFFADGERPPVWNNKDVELDEGDVPCWSLAALLDILPKRIANAYMDYFITITEGNAIKWHIGYVNFKGYKFISSSSDNIIDTCYEMILKLHEQNLL